MPELCVYFILLGRKENILRCRSFFRKDSVDRHSSVSDPNPSGSYIFLFYDQGLDTQNSKVRWYGGKVGRGMDQCLSFSRFLGFVLLSIFSFSPL